MMLGLRAEKISCGYLLPIPGFFDVLFETGDGVLQCLHLKTDKGKIFVIETILMRLSLYAARAPSHLIVHLGDVVEEGKVGILNAHEIAGDLLEARLGAHDFSNLFEGLAILGDVLLLLGLLHLLVLALVVLPHVAGEGSVIALNRAIVFDTTFYTTAHIAMEHE